MALSEPPAADGGLPVGGGAIDTDTARFAEDVLQASRSRPVIVDFWAEWCGPCKQLGPVLEQAVAAAGGKVQLAKVDVDKNQALAAQLRVQSIPAVFAFVDGQPVDGFVGALPESEIRAFVQRIAGQSPAASAEAVEGELALADAALAEGRADAADLYAAVLARDETSARAIAGLGKALLKQGRADDAKQILDGVAEGLAGDPAIDSLRSALKLAAEAGDAGDAGRLRAEVEAAPADHRKRLDLANALLAAGEREEAVEHLLEIVRRDRKWSDEAARKRLLTLFEAFGEEDPLTADARMRLSTILFS